MNRQIITFPCEGAMLSATLDLPCSDLADGAGPTTGLLIVSGGNEIRSGAWGSHARIARAVVEQGYAALRFDRRGIGDSEGENHGFLSAAPDIAAAMAAFRAAVPSIARIIAHGNCDAASALMLFHGATAQGLVLSNPWVFEEEAPAPSGQALRAHYKQRLMNLSAITRLLTGKIPLISLVKSLAKAAKPTPPAPLARQMAQGLATFPGPVRLLIASNDATAQAFLRAWDANDERIAICKGASHAFVEHQARAWLVEQIVDMLKGD